jgi:O-antigen/teichoic acid export membrane protein
MINRLREYISAHKVRKETFWAFVAKGISALAGVAFLIIIPKFWGIATYGTFSLFLAYITIFEIGFGNSINSAIKREIAERKFTIEGKQALITGLQTKTFTSFIGLVILLVSLTIFRLEVVQNHIFLFVALLLLMNFWGLVVNIFEASHRLFFEAVMYSLEYSTKFLLIAGFIVVGLVSFKALICVFIIGYLVAFIFGLIVLFKKFDVDLLDLFTEVDIALSKIFLARTVYLSMAAVSFVLLTRIDSIILSIFTDVTQVGFYNIAAELTKNSTIVSIAIISGVVPMFVTEGQQKLLRDKILQIVLLNFFIACGFLLLSDPFVRIVYGPGFGETATLIQILSIFPLFLALQNLVSEILIIKGKVKQLFVGGLMAVALNILLSVLLVAKFGVYGVAIATIAAYAFWVMLNILALRKYL